jgi:hypothetical protein
MDPQERDERKSKQRHTQALLDKAYDEIVSSQLERVKSKKTHTKNDEDAYRLKLEAIEIVLRRNGGRSCRQSTKS